MAKLKFKNPKTGLWEEVSGATYTAGTGINISDTNVISGDFSGLFESKEIIASTPTAPYNDCNTLPTNTCVSYAIYVNSSALANKPSSFNNGTIMTLGPKAGTNIVTQTAINRYNVMWHRTKYGNTWTAWVQEMTDGSVHSRSYTTISVFDNLGIVGDSFASGATYGLEGVSDGAHYGSAWGRVLSKRNNISVNIFAASGLSTKTWLEDSHGLTALQAADPQDLYLLCLGINDNKTGADPIGTVSDINDNDYTQNPSTFFGNYGRIVAQIKIHAPTSKLIFIVPKGYKTNNIGIAISQIAEHYSVPCIRLDDDPFFSSSFYQDNLHTGHPISILYAGMSTAIERLYSKCAIENPAYFADYVSKYSYTYNNEGKVSATGKNTFTGTNVFTGDTSFGPDEINSFMTDGSVQIMGQMTVGDVQSSGAIDFSTATVNVSTPTGEYDATNKKYVDNALKLKADLTSTNSFTGTNTFNNTVNLENADLVIESGPVGTDQARGVSMVYHGADGEEYRLSIKPDIHSSIIASTFGYEGGTPTPLDVSFNGSKLKDIGVPVANTDAANKKYVDDKVDKVPSTIMFDYDYSTQSLTATINGVNADSTAIQSLLTNGKAVISCCVKKYDSQGETVTSTNIVSANYFDYLIDKNQESLFVDFDDFTINVKSFQYEEKTPEAKLNIENGTGAGSLNMKNTASVTESNDGGEEYTPQTSTTPPKSTGTGAFATGSGTHAEGDVSTAEGILTHAGYTRTDGTRSIGTHAEGEGTYAKSSASHAEGYHTQALASNSHTEGFFTIVNSQAWSGHAEGRENVVNSRAGHAEGYKNTIEVNAEDSHVEGQFNTLSGVAAHAEGQNNTISGIAAHVEGSKSSATGNYSHAEGDRTKATGSAGHAEGCLTTAGYRSHAEGEKTIAGGSDMASKAAHAEGISTQATGGGSHTEGKETIATGLYAHAEGLGSRASGVASHAGG